MQALEASISAAVPAAFPNLLDSDGYAVSEWQRLEGELPMLEKRISHITTAFTDVPVEADSNWRVACAAAEDHLTKEKQFLDDAQVFFNRYVEMRQPLRLALIKSRHAYLQSIIETVGSVWQLEEPAVASESERS
jgi:hypothetical protein